MNKLGLETMFGKKAIPVPGTLPEERLYVIMKANLGVFIACDENDDIVQVSFDENDDIVQVSFDDDDTVFVPKRNPVEGKKNGK